MYLLQVLLAYFGAVLLQRKVMGTLLPSHTKLLWIWCQNLEKILCMTCSNWRHQDYCNRIALSVLLKVTHLFICIMNNYVEGSLVTFQAISHSCTKTDEILKCVDSCGHWGDYDLLPSIVLVNWFTKIVTNDTSVAPLLENVNYVEHNGTYRNDSDKHSSVDIIHGQRDFFIL